MQIDAATLTPEETYKMLIGAVVPRPIAWVTSESAPGRTNLAPFSTFTFVSPFPPMLGFSVGRRRNGEQKDTSRNIRATGEYVVHIADMPLLESLHLSSADYPLEVSEAEVLGLETRPSVLIHPPRLALAPISMECRLHQILPFGDVGSEFIVGEIVFFHVRDDIYKAGKIDTQLLQPICRLGGPKYARLGEIITMPLASTLPSAGWSAGTGEGRPTAELHSRVRRHEKTEPPVS